MSLFGSLMGDFDDDLFMGNHMNAMNMQMRSMNRLMNSLMPDPFNMLTPFDSGFQQNALMERGNPHVGNPMGGLFGFPAMPNMNRLLSTDIGNPNGGSYCSSSVITMSSGPDGRPQIYQATSSTKTGPNGIRETRKTVEDSRRGMKKMAIGHHIGDRSHIIEKEQDLRSGQLEERQEFINLEEDDAEDFDREFTNRARSGVRGARPQEMITIESADDDDVRPRHYSRHHGSGGQHRRQMQALPAPPQQNSVHPHPYNASAARRNYRSKHTKQHQQPHQPQTLTITEIIDDDDDDEVEQHTTTVEPIVDEDAEVRPTTVINPAAAAAANTTSQPSTH